MGETWNKAKDEFDRIENGMNDEYRRIGEDARAMDPEERNFDKRARRALLEEDWYDCSCPDD